MDDFLAKLGIGEVNSGACISEDKKPQKVGKQGSRRIINAGRKTSYIGR